VAKKTTKKTQTKANRWNSSDPEEDWVSPYIVSLRNGDKLVCEFVGPRLRLRGRQGGRHPEDSSRQAPGVYRAVIFGVARS